MGEEKGEGLTESRAARGANRKERARTVNLKFFCGRADLLKNALYRTALSLVKVLCLEEIVDFDWWPHL